MQSFARSGVRSSARVCVQTKQCSLSSARSSAARPQRPLEHGADLSQHSAGAARPTAARAAAAAQPETGFQWGANMKTLGISVALGVIMWFLPAPEGVTTQAWHLLAIFVSTIVGIITQPLPLGAVAMLGLGASMITKTLTFEQAFTAFSSQIPCAPANLAASACSQALVTSQIETHSRVLSFAAFVAEAGCCSLSLGLLTSCKRQLSCSLRLTTSACCRNSCNQVEPDSHALKPATYITSTCTA